MRLIGAKHPLKRLAGRCVITLEDVVNMYREQGGGCLYTGVPFTTDGDWRVSLERKNVDVGYTRQNCCLIAMEFQGTDFTALMHITAMPGLGSGPKAMACLPGFNS
ncbi:hypothetical protein JKP88DRAFT_181251 [Tribonema minus]|uniref:Uncharacterized protein n=1 Tax=Tribonema minus TaxID=303371 RepID=A0A835Z3Q8_9STRA|nr:hypothetical protein JKP88DRAFT_181251 [Tribonema minus]